MMMMTVTMAGQDPWLCPVSGVQHGVGICVPVTGAHCVGAADHNISNSQVWKIIILQH